jgi:hypothetical protein
MSQVQHETKLSEAKSLESKPSTSSHRKGPFY